MREGIMSPPAGMPPPDQPDQAPDSGDPFQEGEPDEYFGGEQQASPEEQEMFDTAVQVVWGMLYKKEETASKLINNLENHEGDIAQQANIIGQVGTSLMKALDSKLESQDIVMNESVRLEVGLMILQELVGLGETAGVYPTDDDTYSNLFTIAADTMMSKYGKDMAERGMIDPRAAQQQLKEMRGVAANKMGIDPNMLTPQQQAQQGGPPPAEGGPPPPAGPGQGGLMG